MVRRQHGPSVARLCLALVTLPLLFGCPSGPVEPEEVDSGTSVEADAGLNAGGDAGDDAGTGESDGGPDAGGEESDAGTDAGVPARTACLTTNDCDDDQRCGSDSFCEPWTDAQVGFDQTCALEVSTGSFAPELRCEFSIAPPGDRLPTHLGVQMTPVVGNFGLVSGGTPSVVATFTTGNTEDNGVIRILSGRDCALEETLGGLDYDGDGAPEWIVSTSSIALGDLDLDGSPEIVAYGADASLLAFTRKAGIWSLLWKAPPHAGQVGSPCSATNHRCNAGWGGIAIHDLDDVGGPEVIREGAVLDSNGQVLSGKPSGYQTVGNGAFPVLADFDGDGLVEMTNGATIWEWNSGAWDPEPQYPGGASTGSGHVVVADFGEFGVGLPASTSEIVVVRNGSVAIYAKDGTVALAPVSLPGAGGGGAPAVADFDGDGLVEVAISGYHYTVVDIDCGPTPRPGGSCVPGLCDYLGGPCTAGASILWSRLIQDFGSNASGASAFDFEGDGAAEALSSDECFVRLHDGKSGEVLGSQPRNSCTWSEMAIVADADGDFRADLIVPSTSGCSIGPGPACPSLDAAGADPQFPGTRCGSGEDCPSGVCDQGYCRCTADAECPSANAVCMSPPSGLPGTGNVCRPVHPTGLSGIRIYSDAMDRWARARQVWNQHPYSPTAVSEDGSIPKRSVWAFDSKHFRANTSGTPNARATGDLTSSAGPFACTAGAAQLSASVCNRGSGQIAPGQAVSFLSADVERCVAVTLGTLQPGACELVSCEWASPPTSETAAVEVIVRPNPEGRYRECHAGNNEARVQKVYCAN